MIPAFPSNISKAVVVFNMGNTEGTNPVKKCTWCTLYTHSCMLCMQVCAVMCVCMRACVRACVCVCVCVYFIVLRMKMFIPFCVFVHILMICMWVFGRHVFL